MALHTDTEIYKATYAPCQLVTQLVAILKNISAKKSQQCSKT